MKYWLARCHLWMVCFGQATPAWPETVKISAGQFKKLLLHSAYKMSTVTGKRTCCKSSHVTETIISTKGTVLKAASTLLFFFFFFINTSTLSNEPEIFHNAGKPLLSPALEFEPTLITLSWPRCNARSVPSTASCQTGRPVTPLIAIAWLSPTPGFTAGMRD